MLNKDTNNTFVDRVRQFASVHDLFVKGGKYIVALSGGADSVAMLHVMTNVARDMQLTIDAAHCNFHLRGDESVRDEMFCKQLCERMHVPFHVVHFDTLAYASLHHVSVEMAARNLRYAYFENLRRDIQADDICVAHHRDDSVETVLLNLVRGTGLRGLRGIQPRNAHIIRPLLALSRQDILDYLAVLQQKYMTDSTNMHNDVKRNKIRLDILPLLKELNPSVAQSIFASSQRVDEALKVYDAAIERSIQDVIMPVDGAAEHDLRTRLSAPTFSLSIERLKLQPSSECTLHEVLSGCGFSSSLVEQIHSLLQCPITGKVFASDTHELTFDRGLIVVQKKSAAPQPRRMRIPEPGTYVYSSSQKISFSLEPWTAVSKPSREPHSVCLDASRVKFPLTVRPVEQGDRFVPFGMKGMKLVSDYLTDRKKNVFQKRAQLIVTDAEGRVCWLVGERVDDRVRVGKETREVLKVITITDNSKKNLLSLL